MHNLESTHYNNAARVNITKEVSALLATLGGLIQKADLIFVWRNYYKLDKEGLLYKEQVFEWDRHCLTTDCSIIVHRLDDVVVPPECEDAFLRKIPIHGIVATMEDLYNKALLEENDVKSSLMVPIFVGSKLWGALSLDDCTTSEDWSEAEIKIATNYSKILSNIIETNDIK